MVSNTGYLINSLVAISFIIPFSPGLESRNKQKLARDFITLALSFELKLISPANFDWIVFGRSEMLINLISKENGFYLIYNVTLFFYIIIRSDESESDI